MKYVAVIGCSFTAHDQPGHRYPEKWNSWSQYIPQDFPDVEVHNYACSAMACNYFDVILKGLVNFKHYKYDAVIIQLSSSTRWSLPLDTPVEDYMRYNDFWNTEIDPLEDLLVVEHEIPTNIPRYKHMIDLSSLITFGGNVNGKANITGIRHKDVLDTDQLQYLNNLVQGGLPLASIFYYNFIKTLPMYEKYFDKVFYYSHLPTSDNTVSNNIGRELDIIPWIEKFPKYIDRFTNAPDDPGHLNSTGNKLLYNDYIMKSAIGDWLNDQ